jgi:hypothetical protein
VASPAPAREGLAARLGLLALALYAGLLSARMQASTPHLVDRDSYFHARYAALLPERGLSREFPWADLTVLGERFADKEPLFHALLAPLCARDAVAGAKAAVAVLDAAAVLALALALRALGARAPLLFAAALLASGNHLLFRMQMARPHLLALGLLALGTAALLTDRRRLAAAIGFVYAWSYAAPHALVLVALCDAAARLLRPVTPAGERRAGLLNLLAAAGGVLAGLVLNPYSPNSLWLFWDQSVRVLGEAWGLLPPLGVRLGAEFQPVTTRSLLATSPGALLLYAGGAALALGGRERPSRAALALFLAASAFLALFLLSAKLVEPFCVLAVLFGAVAARDALGGRPWPRAAAALGAALLLGLHLLAAGRALDSVRVTPAPALAGAGRWIAAHARPGERVLHLSWADFSTLFFEAPAQRYVAAWDPVFLALRDPEGARLLEDVREGRAPLEGPALARRFGARLLAIDATRAGPYEAAVRAGLVPLHEDETGAVFALEGEAPAGSR